MKSSRWSTTVETWVESARHGESSLHWWGFIHRQSLKTLQRLDRRRGSERCHRRSDVGRILEGSLLTQTSTGGYFIPNMYDPIDSILSGSEIYCDLYHNIIDILFNGLEQFQLCPPRIIDHQDDLCESHNPSMIPSSM